MVLRVMVGWRLFQDGGGIGADGDGGSFMLVVALVVL